MFRDVATLIASNPPARPGGVAVADVDGDGHFEFLLAGSEGPNRVLKWKGGELRDLRVPALADPYGRAVGVAAGDLDGDGEEEFYVLNAETADRLFKRHPDGRWEDLFARPENAAVRNPAAGRTVAAIDRRGVGRFGFFVANVAAPMRLYELGPDGRLADLAPALEVDRLVGGRGLLAVPLLADRPDLFCAVEGGPNLLFRNRGDGTFEEVAAALGLADAAEHGRAAVAVAVAGHLALGWANSDGPHRLMVRQADGNWKNRATAALALPSACAAVTVADFDNDGHDELVFNNHGEPNRLFRFTPDPVLLDAGDALEPDGLGTSAAVADIDGDGVLELLIAHGGAAPQPLSLFKARGAEGNGWLRIRPLTRFGAPARGAVVRLNCAGRTRVKPVGIGPMEPVAHFGLGRESRVESVAVTWPDGATLTMADPDMNCTYRVPYPQG